MSSPESDDGVAEYIQHLRAEYDVVVAERAHERKELYADADENDYEDHEPGFDQDPPPDDFLVNAESMVANVSAWAMYDAWEKSGEDQPGYQTPKEFADARMMIALQHLVTAAEDIEHEDEEDDEDEEEEEREQNREPGRVAGMATDDLAELGVICGHAGCIEHARRRRVEEAATAATAKWATEERDEAQRLRYKRKVDEALLEDDDIVVVRASSSGMGNQRAVPGRVLDLASDDEIEMVFPPKASTSGAQLGSRPIKDLPMRSAAEALDASDTGPRPPAAPGPAATPPLDVDTIRQTILDVIPDVEPAYLLSLIQEPAHRGQADLIMEVLLAAPYPQVVKPVAPTKPAVKRPRVEDEAQELALAAERDEKKYTQIEGRPPANFEYRAAASDWIIDSFPRLDMASIKQVFRQHKFFATPVYFALQADMELPEGQYKIKRIATARRPKGKGKEIESTEFAAERYWILSKIKSDQIKKQRLAEIEEKTKADGLAGLLLECECCYSEFSMDGLVQCAEAHLFCRECAIGNADAEVAKRQYIISCPSGEGCAFTETELARFMPASTIALLHKTRTEREVDEAELEGLSKCPFCPYACVIENEQERLFTCMREGCEQVSCRTCHKLDHLPKTCAEMDLDKKISGLHTVEEAMTSALVRNCPKCANPFIKESGCNKISCPSCGAYSCFICGKLVKGYEHFTGAGSNARQMEKGATCPLWDDTDLRTYTEVEAARLAAGQNLNNPAVDAADLEGLHLVAPPAPAAALRHLAPPVIFNRAPLTPEQVAQAQLELVRAREAQAARDIVLRQRMDELARQQRAAQVVRDRMRVEQVAKAKAAGAARVAARAAKDAAKAAKAQRLLGR